MNLYFFLNPDFKTEKYTVIITFWEKKSIS